ncbi:24701_t:CDS:2 [Entrophospora sp. SA101]|nr:24701_t:CDS:2 [Entrophospora sp. SA101]
MTDSFTEEEKSKAEEAEDSDEEGEKIVNFILTADNDFELSHSKFAHKATPVKIVKDHIKCLRTNKCILDTYFMHNLSEKVANDSTFFRLQSAEGQLFGIDLLDYRLHLGLDGLAYRFPAQLSDINVSKNALEVLR